MGDDSVKRRYVMEEMRALSATSDEIAKYVSDMVIKADPDVVASWEPVAEPRLLYALRASRLAMLSMVMYDLDGCEPDDDAVFDLNASPMLMFHERLANLVRETRTTLVGALLAMPEKVVVSASKGQTSNQLSVGGYDDSAISYYVEVPKYVHERFATTATGNDEYLSSSRWLQINELKRAAELAAFLGEKPRPYTVFGYVEDCLSLVEREYPEALEDARPTINQGFTFGHRGGRNTIVSDDELDSKNKETVKKIIALLARIEELEPLASAKHSQLAHICYAAADIEAVPEWVLLMEKAEQAAFPV